MTQDCDCNVQKKSQSLYTGTLKLNLIFAVRVHPLRDQRLRIDLSKEMKPVNFLSYLFINS